MTSLQKYVGGYSQTPNFLFHVPTIPTLFLQEPFLNLDWHTEVLWDPGLIRTWRNFNFDEFICRQQTTKLCKPADPTSTVDVLTERFNNIITEVFDELGPIKEVTLRICRRQPWIGDETREARKKARWLEKRYKAKKDPASKSEWRTAFKSKQTLCAIEESVLLEVRNTLGK